MKPFQPPIVYYPETEDIKVASLICHLDQLTEEQRRIAQNVANGGNPISDEKRILFFGAVVEAEDIYRAYASQNLPYGSTKSEDGSMIYGLIMDKKTANELKRNWLDIAGTIAEYIKECRK